MTKQTNCTFHQIFEKREEDNKKKKKKKKKWKGRKRTKKADPLITMNYVSLESCELLANIKAMVSLQELCKTYPIKSMECKKKKKKEKLP